MNLSANDSICTITNLPFVGTAVVQQPQVQRLLQLENRPKPYVCVIGVNDRLLNGSLNRTFAHLQRRSAPTALPTLALSAANVGNPSLPIASTTRPLAAGVGATNA
jgi:hypothetical protein